MFLVTVAAAIEPPLIVSECMELVACVTTAFCIKVNNGLTFVMGISRKEIV